MKLFKQQIRVQSGLQLKCLGNNRGLFRFKSGKFGGKANL
jgi:hypothetical protein